MVEICEISQCEISQCDMVVSNKKENYIYYAKNNYNDRI